MRPRCARVVGHGAAHAHAHSHSHSQPHHADGIVGAAGGFVARQLEFVDAIKRHALHPRFSLKRASYKSSSEGSRITILGALVNLLLAFFKAVAGILGNSSAMVCDAVHSFSDLMSDVLTLLALQMGSLPPDSDHPYGHGRFEPLGSLAIGWLLVVTAVSFGGSAVSALRQPSASGPRAIALAAAIVSVAVKEMLFRSTKRVADQLSSDVLLANAWHHRSDALSSVVAIVGIGGALMGWRVLDPLCAIGVAVLLGWMGMQIVFEALARLTDTADLKAVETIREAAARVDGVLLVSGVRCRWMSASSALADLSVFCGPETTASSAQRLSSLVRAAVMDSMPEVTEVLVHTQTMCPLLSATTAAPPQGAIEAQVENVLLTLPPVHAVPKVAVRYIHGGELVVDADVTIASIHGDMPVEQLRGLASQAHGTLLAEVDQLRHATISVRLV